jgi:hypothetical protein
LKSKRSLSRRLSSSLHRCPIKTRKINGGKTRTAEKLLEFLQYVVAIDNQFKMPLVHRVRIYESVNVTRHPGTCKYKLAEQGQPCDSLSLFAVCSWKAYDSIEIMIYEASVIFASELKFFIFSATKANCDFPTLPSYQKLPDKNEGPLHNSRIRDANQ